MLKKIVVRTVLLISFGVALSGCYEEENKLQASIIKELNSAREVVTGFKTTQDDNRSFIEQVQKESFAMSAEAIKALTEEYKTQLASIDSDIENFSSHTEDMLRTFGEGNAARFATSVLERAEQSAINYDRVTAEEIQSDISNLQKIRAKLDGHLIENRTAKPVVAETIPQEITH